MKTLGILGGLGPESTGRLYLDLIREFQRTFLPKSNADYPHILINSISAPDVIDAVESIIPAAYVEGLRVLESAGANVIIIACNSAYCFLDQLQATVSVPIIDARQVVEVALRNSGANEYLVLASPTTIKRGLYDYSCAQSAPLAESDVCTLGTAIVDYNLGRRNTAEQSRVVELARQAVGDGRVVIAGCTEVHAMLTDVGIPHIDPMREMSDVVLDGWRVG